jgi:3-isopropylmalate/(R)-2-methylmalate dehydratase large subunit
MAGDITVVNVDLAMAQDSTDPLAISSLNEMRVDGVFDPSKVLLVIDHTFPAADLIGDLESATCNGNRLFCL